MARLHDAQNTTLALESRFDLAYNAAHALALYALRRQGYRSENRYLVFQVLPHTLGLPPADPEREKDQIIRMRRLAEPGKVLDAWAEARKARRDLATSYYVWAPDQQALLKRVGQALQGVGFNWALTGPAAMNQIESHLTGVNDVTLSIPVGRREQVASLLGLGEAPEGSNVTLIERPGQVSQLRRLPT